MAYAPEKIAEAVALYRGGKTLREVEATTGIGRGTILRYADKGRAVPGTANKHGGAPAKDKRILAEALTLVAHGASPTEAAERMTAYGKPIGVRTIYRALTLPEGTLGDAPTEALEVRQPQDDDPWWALGQIVSRLCPGARPAIEQGLQRYADGGAAGLQIWLEATPPKLLTVDERAGILGAIGAASPPDRAAVAYGVDSARWEALMVRDPALRSDVDVAEATMEARLWAVASESSEVSPVALRVLAARWPDRYGKK